MEQGFAEWLVRRTVERVGLTPIAPDPQLSPIRKVDGEAVGRVRMFAGQKLDKAVVAELSLAPGMDYTNLLLRPAAGFNIPKLHVNHMVMPDRIAFDVDLYPLVDLAVRLDVLDEHYARLEAVYNEARRAPAFDCRLSDQGWLRASTSPYFFMATCSPDAAEQAALVVEAYLDAWLGIWDHAQEIEGEEAARVAERLHWITKGLLEREPKRAMLETLLGREVTEKLKAAMV